MNEKNMNETSLSLYRENKILTTDLLVNAVIYSFPRVKCPPIWNDINKALNKINIEINNFNDKCWPDIKKRHTEEETCALFYYHNNCIQMSSWNISERVLNTLSTENEKKIAIIGDINPESDQRCGIQGIHAKVEDAIGMIQSLIAYWDPDKLHTNKSKNITLLD